MELKNDVDQLQFLALKDKVSDELNTFLNFRDENVTEYVIHICKRS